jgi:hypothetical protein
LPSRSFAKAEYGMLFSWSLSFECDDVMPRACLTVTSKYTVSFLFTHFSNKKFLFVALLLRSTTVMNGGKTLVEIVFTYK